MTPVRKSRRSPRLTSSAWLKNILPRKIAPSPFIPESPGPRLPKSSLNQKNEKPFQPVPFHDYLFASAATCPSRAVRLHGAGVIALACRTGVSHQQTSEGDRRNFGPHRR